LNKPDHPAFQKSIDSPKKKPAIKFKNFKIETFFFSNFIQTKNCLIAAIEVKTRFFCRFKIEKSKKKMKIEPP